MASSDRSEIFLLRLASRDNDGFEDLFRSLMTHAVVKSAKTRPGAIRYLDTNTPKVIIVTDHALTNESNRAVLEKLKSYIRNGGRAIFGFDFCHYLVNRGGRGTFGFEFHNHPAASPSTSFFKEEFGVPWRLCGPGSEVFTLGSGSNLLTGTSVSPFPEQSHMVAVAVMGTGPGEEIYSFEPANNLQPPGDLRPVAIAITPVGSGYLMYFGNIRAAVARLDIRILVALCGI
ncbi:uncharacterized protein LY89DRAFT_430859 [Mollisia scopiformis]|uniref:Uncharacterized protein n=1 Tax=Mollisia scopiformis TaxID=149040 RepID=A0A194XMC6_MOLSC|nr:uncharacterized protein LY89DRAFT_430859 [Mollisia scopiformis]KUJ21244.1 hypothetical protein LY89DRAFT_430859 [Mollisia scopiformis]